MAGRVVTQQNSFGSRFLNSVTGVFAGIAIVIICSILLVCNESCSVKNIRAFDEVGKNYTAVANAQSLPENNGKLVAIEGGTLTFTPTADSFYGIASRSFHLRRVVELYQRTESKSGTSTDKEVTYTYDNAWSSSRIDSQWFYDSEEKNANAAVPTGAQYNSDNMVSDDVKLGDFVLTQSQAGQIAASTGITPSGTTADGFIVNGNYIVNADQNAASPKIGDVRISFFESDATTASALGQQNGNSLLEYTTKNGRIINYVFSGIRTGEQMVAALKAANSITTWAFRIILAVFICIGFSMLFTPVKVLVSMIPFLGKYISAFTGGVAGFIGAVIGIALSLLIIAVSWIAVRPLVGIPLLVIVAGIIVLVIKFGKKKGQAAAA